MSAFMSAIGGKADIGSGARMSPFDPKQTWALGFEWRKMIVR